MDNRTGTIRFQTGEEGDFQNKKPQEIQLLNEIGILRKEISFLDWINSELGKELSELQIKYHVNPKKIKPIDMFGNLAQDNMRAAGKARKEFTYLEPLFISYNNKIEIQEKLISESQESLREMEKKSDFLIQENRTLRDQLEDKYITLMNLYKEGPAVDNIGNTFLKLERDDLSERINLLTAENNEIFAKFQEISDKYQKQSVLQADLEASSNGWKKQILELQESCKHLEIDRNQQKNQKEVLESKLGQVIEQVAIAEGEKQDLASKLGRAENEIKILKTQVTNLKRNLNDFEERKGIDGDQYKREVDSMKTKDREQFHKLVALEKEMDFLKDENRKQLKEKETMKNEQEQMIRMLDNYQNKVQTQEKKEENSSKLLKEYREQMQDALLEKDKTILREQQLEKTLQNLSENQRSELNEVKDQYERLMENLRNKQKSILNEREDEINQLNEQLTSSNYLKDKLQKEHSALQQEYKKFNLSLRDEVGGTKNEKASDYERRIIELEEKLQITEQHQNDRIHSINMEKTQIETSYKNQSAIIEDLKQSNDRYRQENQKLQGENQQLNSRAAASQKEKQLVLEEISKVKRVFENKLEYAQNQFSYKMKELQEQLSESIKKERTSRERAIELLQTHEKIEEKMRFEYETRIKELENLAYSLKEDNKMMTVKQI